jgi:TrwC relaxase/AAA domain
LELVRAGMLADPEVAMDEHGLTALKERIARDLSDAVTRADFREAGVSLLGGGGAALRPDIDQDLARRLEIDTSRPLTVREITHLLDNRTALGNDIEGKKKHSPHRSVAQRFGLDEKELPTVEAVRNVLDGKRADGSQPVDEQGKAIPEHVIESSIRKFKSAMGVPATRDTTDAEIQNVADGRINVADYHRQITATSPPVGYVDIVWSADKSVSSAWSLAPSDAEANIIRSWVREASATQMAYLETTIAVARSGAAGQGPTEAAKMAWISTEHVDARPTVDIVRRDAQGREFTETADVPVTRFDPQLHVHNPTFSSILTETGRLSSLNLDLLEGEVKVAGAIGHARLATVARKHGVRVSLGPNGEARLDDVPEWLRKFHSRRTTEGTDAAKDYAAAQGKDWEKLTPDEQIRLLDRGTASKRRDKDMGELGADKVDRTDWINEAKAAGYRHRSVLRPGEIAPELTPEQRIKLAREASLPLLDKVLQDRAVITQSDLRAIAARGLIVSGIGPDPQADIHAVVTTYREQGVTLRGERTNLIEMTSHGERGRMEKTITTGATVALEETLLAEVRRAAVDKSAALAPAAIGRAVERFLAKRPKIDRDGAQWKAQEEMIHCIGEGGRVSLSIGVAGSGKTSAVMVTLVDAWHEDGKTVYGMTVPWTSSAALRDAGVDQALAIDAFLKRIETGKITVDSNTVIVADEVSQIGVQHQVALLKLARATGAQLHEIGDPRQCQAVSAPGIDLMVKAIGDENIAKILTTVRQQHERDRAVAGMFRDGQAADAVKALEEDGRFHLVAGGREATVAQTARLWRTMTEANKAAPDYSLLVMTDTNAHALEIGTAIRAIRRGAGELGRDEVTLRALDPNSGETFDLPVAVGDRLRLFTRVNDADAGRSRYLGSNGDVVEVRRVLSDGLRIRNAAGEEGRITWAQMKPWRAPKNDPVRVTMGMAVTVDSAQSMTRSAAIYSLPNGTGVATGYKSYTAMSRHTGEAHLVVSDAAERKAIVKRQMLGAGETPSRGDVVRNIAANLSRFATKRQATTLLGQAIEVQRNSIRSLLHGSAIIAKRQGEACISRYKIARLGIVNKGIDMEETKKPKVTQEMRDAVRQTTTIQQNEALASHAHEVQRQAEQEQRDGLER